MSKVLLLLVISFSSLMAIDWYDIYVCSGFNFGYSFKSGFNWGPKFSLGIYQDFKEQTTNLVNVTYGFNRFVHDSSSVKKEYYWEIQGGRRFKIVDDDDFEHSVYALGSTGISILKLTADTTVVRPRVSLNGNGMWQSAGISQNLFVSKLKPFTGTTLYGGPAFIPFNVLYTVSKWD